MTSISISDVAGVAAPAVKALAAEGYTQLADLDGAQYADLLALHGVGARGLERLGAALKEHGMELEGAPAAQAKKSTWTVVEADQVKAGSGTNAKDIKTHPGQHSPEGFMEALPQRRVAHTELLLALFGRATGEEPVMWGPSMIGYGFAHYVYATGREGDTFRVGFAPKGAKISLYGIQGTPAWEEFSTSLGKHTTGKSCVYINKPEDVDLEVLEQLITAAWEAELGKC